MRKLEVIGLNAKDCKQAELFGADRIELVSAMEVGGLSPEIETIREVVNAVNIPVNVMIRFKSENFIYDQPEIERLVNYIKVVKELGINGIVFGSLDQANNVDSSQLAQIIDAAVGLDITYHRAIDQDDSTYLDNFKVIDGHVTNVLTSGGVEQPIVDNIKRLEQISNYRTNVLVGGGINQSNYQQMFDTLQTCDFHIGSLAYKEGNFELGIDGQKLREVKDYLINSQI